MFVRRKQFPSILSDNEETFLSLFIGLVESVDELSTLQITKVPEGYIFRLSPSTPQYNNPLIEEILKFHNMFKIHLELSKSIKSSGVLSFKITTNY